KEAAEIVMGWWPKKWSNVEARFVVEEIGLGFSCDDKTGGGWFRVTVLDEKLEKIVYMEGANNTDVRPKVAINVKKFPHDVLREMFHMARCKREFERTDDRSFASMYQTHRHQALSLWKRANEERPEREKIEQRVVDLIAECLVDVDKSRIVFSARLGEDLGAYEVDCYDVIALIEDEFGIELPDADLGLGGESSETESKERGCWSCCAMPGNPGIALGEITVQDLADLVWTALRAS
ncbi:MAG: hypothetical protein V1792_18280, partial [Pseudomonadota bacterium]